MFGANLVELFLRNMQKTMFMVTLVLVICASSVDPESNANVISEEEYYYSEYHDTNSQHNFYNDLSFKEVKEHNGKCTIFQNEYICK